LFTALYFLFYLDWLSEVITIENLPQTDLLAELGNIFQAVAEDLEPMTRETKGQLFEIFIPVFQGTSDERVCKFRTLLSTDEILDVSRISKLINGWKGKFRLAIRGRPQLHKNQMLRSKSSHVRLKKTNSTSFG
jgi:hypothetical protein